ncbi:hypothetical protein SKAU_G00114210 [Synaphobranchus kaupii]|uniref:Uncharacterized protein n=1 Tax=Synaphobranchus kaupii TaxID=118154 RepID=A0A9Q1G0X6_SYNKA|nr:hypothetical protein SKAU_G00114210 [Synaphobranchus kaupii]
MYSQTLRSPNFERDADGIRTESEKEKLSKPHPLTSYPPVQSGASKGGIVFKQFYVSMGVAGCEAPPTDIQPRPSGIKSDVLGNEGQKTGDVCITAALSQQKRQAGRLDNASCHHRNCTGTLSTGEDRPKYLEILVLTFYSLTPFPTLEPSYPTLPHTCPDAPKVKDGGRSYCIWSAVFSIAPGPSLTPNGGLVHLPWSCRSASLLWRPTRTPLPRARRRPAARTFRSELDPTEPKAGPGHGIRGPNTPRHIGGKNLCSPPRPCLRSQSRARLSLPHHRDKRSSECHLKVT